MGDEERLDLYVLRAWWKWLAAGITVVIASFWVITRIDNADTRSALITSAAAIFGALAVIFGGLMVEQYRREAEQRQRIEDERLRRLDRFEQLQWESLHELDEWILYSMDISLRAFAFHVNDEPLPPDLDENFAMAEQRSLVLRHRLDNLEIAAALMIFWLFAATTRSGQLPTRDLQALNTVMTNSSTMLIEATLDLRRHLSGRDEGRAPLVKAQEVLKMSLTPQPAASDESPVSNREAE